MNLGRNIQMLRKQKNITQEDLAAQLGVTAAAVSKWENNYTLPDIMMLCVLADCFEVTTDALLGRDQPRKYAIVAAETQALGETIAEIAKQSGIITKAIYTSFEEADAAASVQQELHCILVGFRHGFYGSKNGIPTLVSVAPEESEILERITQTITKYLNEDA